MIEVVKDQADIIGTTLGVDVIDVTQHPSGAYALHTSVGKGYLPDDTNVEDHEALAETIATTLKLMKDIHDGSFDPYVHTDDSGKQDDEPPVEESTESSPTGDMPEPSDEDALVVALGDLGEATLDASKLELSTPKAKRARKSKADE